MKVFAIGDPHLSSVQPKPMNVFGSNWDNYFERMQAAWQEAVKEEDLVLIPGDISWAMQLKDAKPDLDALGALPGRSVIIRGNHDYWWNSLSKVRSILPEGMQALQNDAIDFGPFVVAGTRLWTCPGSHVFKAEEDEKIYRRELGRLELSLKAAQKLRREGQPLFIMLHYPPFNEKAEDNEATALLEAFGADIVVYGHLHDKSSRLAFQGERNGVEYHLTSCDYLDFVPKLIWEEN